MADENEPLNYGFPYAAIDASVLPIWLNSAAQARFSVEGKEGLKVSALGSLDRGIRIEAGTASGDAVTTVFRRYETQSLPLPDVASRWYLVAIRRNWSGSGTSTLVYLPSGTTAELPPIGDAPTQRSDKPGVESDQPLALVRVTQEDRTVQQIIDLRAWAGPGGVEAAHQLALNYLAEPGAAVKIGSTVWRYELQANGVWDWSGGRPAKQLIPLTSLYSADPPRSDRLAQEAPSVYRDGSRVYLSGVASNTAQIAFAPATPFALGTLPVGFRPKYPEYFTIEVAYATTRLWVRPDGGIYFMFATSIPRLYAREGRFSLSGISFEAAS